MNLQTVEEKIGYTFRDRSLLKIALTHSSYANNFGGVSYERMEFLGDSVIQLIVSEVLYASGGDEGAMTAKRQQVVAAEPLERAVKTMHLDEYIYRHGGEVGKKAISSVFESVTAAIYLDGGMEQAKKFVLSHLAMEGKEVNYKGELQELLQAKGKHPVYTFLEKTGEEHDPVFLCQVEADGLSATGAGKNKKQAEQNAAKAVLERLKGSK